MRKRGIRVVIGGDYGFDMTPQGTNARDLEHFVKLFGYSPSEALACATRIGAELMDMGHELGRVREGYLADLLLVDGDPLADVSILQRQERLMAIRHFLAQSTTFENGVTNRPISSVFLIPT